MRIGIFLFGALFLLVLTGCDQGTSARTGGAAQKAFSVVGVVQTLQPDGKTVVVQHDAVSNYMGAMTMAFEVKDREELNGLKAGDRISFRMVVTKEDGWIEHIAKLPDAPVVGLTPTVAHFRVRHALAPLDEGDRLPDYHFTNELGQSVNMNGYRGQVVVFTFFFTKCPFPTACPRLAENFADAAAKLPLLSQTPTVYHFFSISFDPQNDTPAVLQEYGKQYHYDPDHWSFLTGSAGEISDLADQCGEEYEDTGTTITHGFRTVVVDPRGRIRKILSGSTWRTDELILEMIKAGR